jgi:hypothetical protein
MDLTRRAKDERGVFDSLQEQKTMDKYGNVLGRLVCMYIRMLDQEDESGTADNKLTDSQQQRMRQVKEAMEL